MPPPAVLGNGLGAANDEACVGVGATVPVIDALGLGAATCGPHAASTRTTHMSGLTETMVPRTRELANARLPATQFAVLVEGQYR